ncbi:MAG: DUF2809 domain-containing protein [Clostridia bacterium]|nr:DUF2809 domain-containing protein [Clostridia bacterium]
MKKSKLVYALLFLTVFAIEVLIALFIDDNFIRPYGGDILVTVLICLFIRAFFPIKTKVMPLYVFLFAVIIEIGQYFDFVKLMGFENNQFISTILGRSFSFVDIICYALGCIIFHFLEWLVLNKAKARL